MGRLSAAIRDLAVDTGMARLALRLRRSRPMILMYHGVTHDAPSEVRNGEGKHMPASLFEAQMQLLARYRRVVPLERLVDDLAAGRDTANAVAITFDDGYENNFSVALPILLRHRMPATIFLCTGFIGTGQWIWTDLLEHAMAATRRESLTVPFVGQPLNLEGPGRRIAAIRLLKAALKRLPGAECREQVARLVAQLDVDPGQPFGDYRFMDWQQVRELDRAGISIGAHTVSHPILSRVPADEGEREILDSRDRIVRELGHCSDIFAYPNGKTEDFGAADVAVCQRHFKAAVSTNRGVASDSERYALRRLSVSDGPTSGRLEWTLLQER